MKVTEARIGITAVTLIAVRSNPDHRSEQVTQMLLGEYFEILNQWGHWIYILHQATGVEGWIPDQSYRLSPENRLVDESLLYTNLETVYITPDSDNRHPIALLPGSSIPVQPELGASFKLGAQTFHFVTPLPDKLEITAENRMEALAQLFIHTPFLWGGRSLYGIDNAGLTQLVYKMYGIRVPGNLQDLVKQGQEVAFAHESQPGDIAFFENEHGEIIHSGMITQPGQIIHCHGLVREDPLDHAGIFGVSEEKYLFYLRVIKRILPV